MEFLGKNKLFELALDFWGIELEDAFSLFKKVRYENDEKEFIIRESLAFSLKDGGLMSIDRDYVSCLDEPESFSLYSHQSDDDNAVVQDCILDCGKLILKSEKDISNDKQEPLKTEKQTEGAESCKDCLCSNCITRAKIEFPCSPCPRCEEEFEETGMVIPVYKCNKFEPDNP